MRTYIWIIQPIGETTMLAVVADSEEQARDIARHKFDGEKHISQQWLSDYLQEIEHPPFASIGNGEAITFGNWNL